MLYDKQKVDHGFREIKWLIRKRLVEAIEPEVAVDFYAGEGRLLSSLYRPFRLVHAIERDPAKWKRLARRVQTDPDGPRVSSHCMDNVKFARTRLGGIRDVRLLDFDAYGNPYALIREVFRHWSPEARTAIAVTDGGRLGLVRNGWINLPLLRPDLEPDPDPANDRVPTRLLSTSEYELLVSAFWREVAAASGFAVRDEISAWKKGKMVYYHGLFIEPN